MLNQIQNVLLVLFIIASALFFQFILERFWPRTVRREHNEVIGWQLGILGTTYAVILGFMLYTVWTDFGLAEVNAEAEANAASNIYRISQGLPPAQQVLIRSNIRAYVDTVVHKDWPEMEAGKIGSFESHRLNEELWHIVMSVKTATPAEISAQDHTLSELSSLSEHRRIRQLQSASQLPGVLWWVLIIGAIVTVMSACMFGGSNSWLHTVQVLCFSALIALVLVAIADIDRPFQGSVHVSDDAFRRALSSMDQP